MKKNIDKIAFQEAIYRFHVRYLQLLTYFRIKYHSIQKSTKNKIFVVLRFDDATIDQYEIGFPLVESFGVKAMLAVPTSFIGMPKVVEGERVLKPIDDFRKLRELICKGWDVVPHGRNHLLNGSYMLMRYDQLVSEVVGAISDFIKYLDVMPYCFVPPGIITHKNPLGKRELKLMSTYYKIIFLNSGYNYPMPILNDFTKIHKVLERNKTAYIWSIPVTDSDKWVQHFISLAKDCRYIKTAPIVIVLFLHEIYENSAQKTKYGFSALRLKKLINGLLDLGIPITTFTELMAMGSEAIIQ